MIDLDRYPVIALDTETTGLQYPKDRAFGVSIAVPGRSWYWDLRLDPHIRDWLNRALPQYKGIIVCHNASFDYRMLSAAGISCNVRALDDTVIRACAIDEHLHSYSLDSLAQKYLGTGKVNDIYAELAALFGGLPTRNVQMKNIIYAPKKAVEKYAKVDAELTLQLWMWQEDYADKDSTLAPPIREIWEFERSVMPDLIDMEMNGIRVDADKAERAIAKLDELVGAEQKTINDIAGRRINVNSGPQIRELFRPTYENGHWQVGGTSIMTTGSGAPSFGADSLRLLEDDERAKIILNIRSMIKTRDTFLAGHVLGHMDGDRVYPTINQSKGESGGTGTGRLSYQNPAMQQIPSRNKKVAAIVKPVFLPDLQEAWMDVDLNSFEVRVFAHLVAGQDPNIVRAYENDPALDFHQWVASLTGLPRNATYSGQPNAKQLNLSMIFNAGNGSTADQMGLPWEPAEFEKDDGEVVHYKKAGPEAMELIGRYHQELPGVKKLQNAAKASAIRRGFIFTKCGRRIHFPNGYKAYKASGLLIQATAADYNKENIQLISKFCNANGGRLLLNTHDSYSMSVPEDCAKEFWRELRPILEMPDRARVPLVVDMSGVGDDWWSALNNQYDF